ncbi:DUF6112 family protein [Nostocoides veronense]
MTRMETVTLERCTRTLRVLVSVGAAVIAGGGVAWMNWLLSLGSRL